MTEASAQPAPRRQPVRPHRFWLSVTLVWVFVLGGYAAASLALTPGGSLTTFGDVVQCFVPLLAVTALLSNASSVEWRQNLFWMLLALGCALWMAGQFTWTYYEVIVRQTVPNPSLSDVVFFLHVVPMFGALALAPHAGKSDLNLRLSYLDFTLLLVWWIYLYLFTVLPWQFAAPNTAVYGNNYNELYVLECIAFVVAAGVLASVAHGRWRTVYLHLLGAGLTYSAASWFINEAIDRNQYYTGSLYDLPLMAAFLWFATAGLLARGMKLESDPAASTPGQNLAARFAMAAVLSMPALALWGGNAPHTVRDFRLIVTQFAVLAGILLISLRRRVVDRDRLALLHSLQDSVDRMQRLQSKLVQNEKLASLGNLAAGAAHEINNPLTGILGYTELLSADTSLNEHSRGLLQKIREQSLRIKTLINNLLSFARQMPAERSLLDVGQIISQALQLGNLGVRGKNVRVELKAESHLPTIRGDADHLLRVFFNLIDNALDAMEERGGVLHIRIFGERGKVVAEFADTGPGMKNPQKVFDPFYTTKPVGKGTGLGLSLCYGIVQEHGGDLSCFNRPEGGATFRVELPAATPMLSRLPPPSQPVTAG